MNDRVIAQFHVVGTYGTHHLAIERTADDRTYLLLRDKTPVADVRIDATGAYASHQKHDRFLSEDQIATWARMAGWKILTYRKRRVASRANQRLAI